MKAVLRAAGEALTSPAATKLEWALIKIVVVTVAAKLGVQIGEWAE